MNDLTTPRPSRSSEGTDTATRDKSRLFCDCGRAAPQDAWAVRPGPDGVALVCPDCRAVLTVR